jgi:hypothetical protein
MLTLILIFAGFATSAEAPGLHDALEINFSTRPGEY